MSGFATEKVRLNFPNITVRFYFFIRDEARLFLLTLSMFFFSIISFSLAGIHFPEVETSRVRIFEVSNSRRIGMSEVRILRIFCNAVACENNFVNFHIEPCKAVSVSCLALDCSKI